MWKRREMTCLFGTTAILAALPVILPRFYVLLLGTILIYGLFAMSFNVLFGYTGLLSFGQAGFFAAGAYVTAYVLKQMPSSGMSIFIAIILSLCLSAILSVVVGIVCVRLTGWVFAMVTLAFGQIIYAVVYKWRDVTGGDDGLYGIPVPKLGFPGMNIDLQRAFNHYYFILFVVAVSVVA